MSNKTKPTLLQRIIPGLPRDTDYRVKGHPQNGKPRLTDPQSQSLFFSMLPLEVRALIYLKVLETEIEAVHILKHGLWKPRVDLIRCWGPCTRQYNYKCGGRHHDEKPGALLPFLRVCRKGFGEAKIALYDYNTFDFRSFDALLLFSKQCLPETWRSIRNIHLRYHFGNLVSYMSDVWNRLTNAIGWRETWAIIARMPELRKIVLELDCVTDFKDVGIEIEKEMFKPLKEVKQVVWWRVTASWWPDPKDPEGKMLEDLPFKVIHSARKHMRQDAEDAELIRKC